jgi:membrane-associated phospholipid phosphatase
VSATRPPAAVRPSGLQARASAPLTPWTAELAFRARQLFWLKLIGTTLWTSVFFVGYFHLLRNPAYPVTVMPLTWFDALVPFQPAMLVPYLSLWLYIGVAPGLQRGFWPLAAYSAWMTALLLTGLAFFHYWPTAVPPLGIDRTAHFGFAMLEGVDANGNACPSMHVAASVFTAVRLHAVLREIGAPALWRWLNLAWVLLIAWSTMAVRQHVALDVLGGVLLGLVFAYPSLRWRPPSYHPPPQPSPKTP